VMHSRFRGNGYQNGGQGGKREGEWGEGVSEVGHGRQRGCLGVRDV
jgi:hypothetical protein